MRADLNRLFRSGDEIEIPDLWEEAQERSRRPRGSEPSNRRIVAGLVAVAVFVAAAAFAWRAFHPVGSRHQPASTSPQSAIALLIGNRQQSASLAVVNPDGSDLRALTTGNEPDAYVQQYKYVEEFDPTWSPDGQTIAFVRWYDGATSLCAIDVNGSNFRVLARERDLPFGQVAWSPDGSRLVAKSKDGLVLLQPDGSNPQAIPNLPTPAASDPPDWLPTWSPDGTKIAFTNKDLWTIAADGSGLSKVTNLQEGQYAFDASWSPDGSQIAFSLGGWKGGAQSPGEIYMVVVDGTGLTRITGGVTDDWGHPTWSPDGS